MRLSWDQWHEVVGQLEVLKTYWQRLSERERYIVLGVTAASVVFLMVLTYGIVEASATRMGTRIKANRQRLEKVWELKKVYQKAERQINALERTIKRTGPNFRLATELERLARKRGVDIDSIKDRAGPPNDLYQERQVTVAVKQLTLKTLTDLLYDIEQSRQLMRVTSIQVKPNFQDPTLLNVNFVVSTFSLL